MTSKTINFARKSIVIDSNVWISAIIFGGNSAKVFEKVKSNDIKIVISAEIITEIRRVLNSEKAIKKFKYNFCDLFEKLLHNLISDNCIQLVGLGSITIDICRDPSDDMVLETAVLGSVEYIVSGDKDLLILEKYKDITIIKPKEYLNL